MSSGNRRTYIASSAAPNAYEFTDATSNAAIVAVLEDISIEEPAKRDALKHLSSEKLSALLSDTAIIRDRKIALLNRLDFRELSRILLDASTIPEDMLTEVHRRMKAILQRSSMRRRGSATTLATSTKELFAQPNPGERDTCLFKPVQLDTLMGMCETFPVLQFVGLSQHTKFLLAETEEDSVHLGELGPVAIISLQEPIASAGGHFNAFIRAGISWYNADNSFAVLRERTHGQPTWNTVPPMLKTRVIGMIFCYADASKLPELGTRPLPGALHGHPTFSQDGMGSCSIDALASVLCFADGFREIMAAAMQSGIEQIVVKHLGYSGERVYDVPRCLAEVEAFISSRLVIHSAPAPAASAPPLPVSTAPEGSMFFSKEYRLPSAELFSRVLRYLAATAIRFHTIRLEATFGHVEATRNTSWGITSRRVPGLKSLAFSKRMKHTLRKRESPLTSSARPGMAVKATRRSSVNRMGRSPNRGRSRRARQEKRINAKRGSH